MEHDGEKETPQNTAEAEENSEKSTPRLRLPDLLRGPFDIRSIALTGLFILALFYTIYFMRGVLLPVVLALLLSYLLRPIVRALARLHISPLYLAPALFFFGGCWWFCRGGLAAKRAL